MPVPRKLGSEILALTDDMPRAQRQWQFHVEQTFSFRDLSIEKDELASVRDWLRKGARGLKLLTADLSTPQATGVASARLYARFNRRTGCVRGGGKQFRVEVDGSSAGRLCLGPTPALLQWRLAIGLVRQLFVPF